MAYIDYEYYCSLYDGIDEKTFNRLEWEARKRLDNETTGVDGIRKLKHAFPTDEDDAEAVKRCMCKLIAQMDAIERTEAEMKASAGYTKDEATGALIGKIITSKSSGSESISFATSNTAKAGTLEERAIADMSIRDEIYRRIIRDCLSGTQDRNGVNLLFGGAYPLRLEVIAWERF